MEDDWGFQKVSPYLSELEEIGAKHKWLKSQPKPLLLIEWKGGWQDGLFPKRIGYLIISLAKAVTGNLTCASMRCVELDRLKTVLTYGCDVTPTNSVLWLVELSDKALEYGGDTKVMMVFDIRKTEATYSEISADIEHDLLEKMKTVFPTVIPSADGSKLWLTKLPEDDKRVTTSYEVDYGRWIDGDPFDALIAVFVLGRDLNDLQREVERVIQDCEPTCWS